ncbi:hypothetical protein [Agriterribacter sp.]|uniref:hypothetical protein n=1 Tax=Agriterribacter sp. TaxID=2821509 RepID=UPI002CBCC580|nr:hypothetical protein [Agriterribacter sp.]HTN05632.1 hypothetical protein [Agriterribacter sp.]
MQKVELTNKQYRLLLQLVSLGIDVIDNAALGGDEEEEEDAEVSESPLFNDATELEGYLMAQSKRFGIKDIIQYDADEDYLEYSEPFIEEQEMIAHSAYLNKTAEIASFQLGMRDYKDVNGPESLESITPQEGADKIMSFSLKYLNEIFENGFDNFHLNTEGPAKIISLSSE